MSEVIYSFSQGSVVVELEGDQLIRAFFSKREILPGQGDGSREARHIVNVLDEYFETGLLQHKLQLREKGTVFQQKVWRALRKIPSGETLTYGALAKQLGTGARAVGAACRANPLVLFTPCHRVVSSAGIGGFAGKKRGQMITIKQALLKHEAARFKQ